MPDVGAVHDAEDAAAFPAMGRDQPVAAVTHFAGMGERGAFDCGGIGADSFENAQAILVNVNAGAGGAQAIGALVHAHAPAALGKRARRGQPGKSGAGDFGTTLGHRATVLAA